MRKFSKKREALERAYKKAKEEIMTERPPICEGCGTASGRISFSHRVPRSDRIDLLADKLNIDLMCDTCHERVEIGHFHLLSNSKEIIIYIAHNEPELLLKKQDKFGDLWPPELNELADLHIKISKENESILKFWLLNRVA